MGEKVGSLLLIVGWTLGLVEGKNVGDTVSGNV